MKNLFSKTFLILIIFLFATMLTAQTTTDNLTIKDGSDFLFTYTSLTLDSAETVYSQPFGLADYNDTAISTSPVYFGYKLAAADSHSVSIYWFVNYINPATNAYWIVADTLATITSATLAKSTANLNSVKAPWNKLKIVNNSGYPATTLYFGGVKSK